MIRPDDWPDDRSAGDDGAAGANATGPINAAGANNGIRLLDRRHHGANPNERGDGDNDCKLHRKSPWMAAHIAALGSGFKGSALRGDERHPNVFSDELDAGLR